MKKIIALITLAFFLFDTVSAQVDFELFEDWYEYLNIPEEFSSFPEIIYLVLLPFLAVMAIVFGILGFIFKNLFDKRVKVILAFVFAFSLLYLGPLTAVVSALLQFTSVFSVVVFFVLVFFLMAVQIFRRTTKGYGDAKQIYTKVKGYRKSVENIDEDIENLVKERGELDKKIGEIVDKIIPLTETIASSKSVIVTQEPGTDVKTVTDQLRSTTKAVEILERQKDKMESRKKEINDRIINLRKRKRELKLDLS